MSLFHNFVSQVAEVEDVVNDKINKGLPVYAYVAPLEQASAIRMLLCLCLTFVSWSPFTGRLSLKTPIRRMRAISGF